MQAYGELVGTLGVMMILSHEVPGGVNPLYPRCCIMILKELTLVVVWS